MKNKLVVVFLLLFILIYFNGCGDNSVNIVENDPNKEIIINRQDFVYDYNEAYRKCLDKIGGYISYQPNGVKAIAISKDKNIIYSNGYYCDLVIVENNNYRFEQISTKSIEVQWGIYSVLNIVFSPYDNNLALVFMREEKFVSEPFLRFQWYYYKIDTKILEPLKLDTIKHKDFYNNPKLVSWLNTSTPGNDKFFFENNKILNYPNGLIEVNPTGLQIAENEEVISVSPDMQKYFTLKENELYLNGRKIPSSEYVYWKNVPISWSDDSKYFLGVGIQENLNAHLNVIYKMDEGSNSTFKIHRIIDVTRNFCSRQNPSRFGFDEFCQAVFKSESTIAMSIFQNLREEGDLFEIGFNGKFIRKLTNQFP